MSFVARTVMQQKILQHKFVIKNVANFFKTLACICIFFVDRFTREREFRVEARLGSSFGTIVMSRQLDITLAPDWKLLQCPSGLQGMQSRFENFNSRGQFLVNFAQPLHFNWIFGLKIIHRCLWCTLVKWPLFEHKEIAGLVLMNFKTCNWSDNPNNPSLFAQPWWPRLLVCQSSKWVQTPVYIFFSISLIAWCLEQWSKSIPEVIDMW